MSTVKDTARNLRKAAMQEGFDLGTEEEFVALAEAKAETASLHSAIREVEQIQAKRFMDFVEAAEHRRELFDKMNDSTNARGSAEYKEADQRLRAEAIAAGVIDEHAPDLMEMAFAAPRNPPPAAPEPKVRQ